MNVIVKGYVDGKKIVAVKSIRAATGLGLKEAKQVADDIDQGREPEVALLGPECVAELDAGGITYAVVPLNVPLDAFVDALGAYPRDLSVGMLYATLSAAVALEKAQEHNA